MSIETFRSARKRHSQFKPLPPYWNGVRLAAIVLTIILFAAAGCFFETGLGNLLEGLLGALIGVATIFVFTLFTLPLSWLLKSLPTSVPLTLGGVVGSIIFLRETQFLRQLVVLALEPGKVPWPLPNALSSVTLVAFVLANAALIGTTVLMRENRLWQLPRGTSGMVVILILICLALDGFLLAHLAGEGANPFPRDFQSLSGDAALPPDLENPALAGSLRFETLTYGSGLNQRRPEFGQEADLISRTVDGSKLLPDWKDSKRRMREWFWGFGLAEAPLNARVWTPVGSGPFPLVLIVHGNHAMEDYSESGYAYLGELLASRGFVVASVDQNFINATWSGDFRGREMPARAWLLLEHLRLWRDWNNTTDHRFGGKIDMDQIALIGHSRGGEAAAIAAVYNTLPAFTDDATLKFDYNFSIRSVVAIAQIDRRYRRRSELQDINFLALHGSYDSDEPAFHGFRQYNRVRFTDDDYWFKAGVYIHGANHGQFNTSWGRQDSGPPNAWLLNLAPIIAGQDQRHIANVYVSAFLEATLHQDRRYLSLFRNAQFGVGWLSEQTLVTQFADSHSEAIATFEEDLDVTTGTWEGSTMSSKGLTLWREEELLHRDKLSQGTNVAMLGWNQDDGENSPYWTISLPLRNSDPFSEQDVLAFDLSGSMESAPTKARDDARAEQEQTNESEHEEVPSVPNFTIALVDRKGATSQILFKADSLLAPPLRVQLMKSKHLNTSRYGDFWEPVLQTCEIPLDEFTAVTTDFDLSTLHEIRLQFDQISRGVLILDNIVVRRPFRPAPR